VGVVIAAVRQELGHVIDIGVTAAQFVTASNIVDPDEETLLASVGHLEDQIERLMNGKYI
jgi:hypothetical protein